MGAKITGSPLPPRPGLALLAALTLVALLEPATGAPPQGTGPSAGAPAVPHVNTIAKRILPPDDYRRLTYPEGSFGAWLRDLPLRPGRPPVHLHDGRLKADQSIHHAVVDMEIGTRDLQQCADAVIRLRAEYLFRTACQDDIRFNFTSGDTALWKDWRQGMRPVVKGNRVSWNRGAEADSSYESFRRYLDVVFTYAGSASLARELVRVQDPSKPESGDVFIQGGTPGHAVLVVDVAQNPAGDRVFLLAQSYMPAQEIHILRSDAAMNPWYGARASGSLNTPQWTFAQGDLLRFAPTRCEIQGVRDRPEALDADKSPGGRAGAGPGIIPLLRDVASGRF